ncbi:MAG: class I mannose-6-phosphate isomerase [Armatimonadetes bacterium]|nr:class I mannose-6-phosphate isomerase [Armatimonadota bacterium]
MKYPLLVSPRPVERVWGGTRIATTFGRTPPGGQPIGESWEIYGELPIRNGPLAGKSLDQAARQLGTALLGTSCAPEDGFPLLTKWLDCNSWLSIQVHPDDRLARELTGDPAARGKTESWYFHRCEPGASYIHGLSSDVEGLDSYQGEKWLELVNRVEAHQGACCLTEAGTVHALGPGLLLYEIQQSSDLTYRLYDWGRVGLDGRPRQLHPVEARRSIRESRPQAHRGLPRDVIGRLEVLSAFFVVERLEGDLDWKADPSSFEILTTLDAAARLKAGGVEVELAPGGAAVIPASAGAVALRPGEGHCLRIRVPSYEEG